MVPYSKYIRSSSKSKRELDSGSGFLLDQTKMDKANLMHVEYVDVICVRCAYISLFQNIMSCVALFFWLRLAISVSVCVRSIV